MLNKANIKLHRLGAESIKCVFTIDVKRVILGGDTFYDYDGNTLSVCFERGGKLASSKDKIFNSERNTSHVLNVDEKLSLVVTLYKDKDNGEFQEKKGKLILRQLKKNKNAILSHLNGYKGIGTVKLALHELIHTLISGSKDYTLPLENKPDITIQAKLSVKLISSNNIDNNDDDLSLASYGDGSDNSVMAANFDGDSSNSGRQTTSKISVKSDSKHHILTGFVNEEGGGEEEEELDSPYDTPRSAHPTGTTPTHRIQRSLPSSTSEPDFQSYRNNSHHNNTESTAQNPRSGKNLAAKASSLLTSKGASVLNPFTTSSSDHLATSDHDNNHTNISLNQYRKQLIMKDHEIHELKRQLSQQEEAHQGVLGAVRLELGRVQIELKR